jgi:hypothetical protein
MLWSTMENAKPALRSRDTGGGRFDDLLRRLDSDRERAGERYEQMRRKLIKFFEWNDCVSPEDLVDETFDRVTRRLGDETVRDLHAFAWGVAKRIRQEAHKKAARLVDLTDANAEEHGAVARGNLEADVHEKIQDERRYRCLNRCLAALAEGERRVLLSYHATAAGHAQFRERLAASEGLSVPNLRVRVHRVRHRVEVCVRRCTREGAPRVVRS